MRTWLLELWLGMNHEITIPTEEKIKHHILSNAQKIANNLDTP